MIQLTNEQLDRLKSRLEGLCSGAYMGDLLGFPWEQLTRSQILRKTRGRGVQGTRTTFRPRILGPQWGDRTEYRPSDDWRLTMAGGLALQRVRRDGLSVQTAHAVEYVRAMKEETVGWGPTVLAGLRPCEIWLDTGGIGGRHPETLVPVTDKNQSGTGPLMKASLMALPLLFVQLETEFSDEAAANALRDLYRVGRMTHSGDAVFVTIPYVLLIAQLLDPRHTDGEPRISWNRLERWLSVIDRFQTRIFAGEPVAVRAFTLCRSALISLFLRQPELFDRKPAWVEGHPEYRLSSPESIAAMNASFEANAADPAKIGLTAAQYALAQALLFDAPGDSLVDAVLAAVNRGGDTDTHGCITGAYAGAFHGRHHLYLTVWWKEHDQPACRFANGLFERYVLPTVSGSPE